MNVCNFLVFREETQVLNALLDEKKLIDDLLILYAGVFEVFNISAFLFHLCKDVSKFLLIGDEVLRLGNLHEEVFKNSQIYNLFN
jgi:hypothetical protein